MRRISGYCRKSDFWDRFYEELERKERKPAVVFVSKAKRKYKPYLPCIYEEATKVLGREKVVVRLLNELKKKVIY